MLNATSGNCNIPWVGLPDASDIVDSHLNAS